MLARREFLLASPSVFVRLPPAHALTVLTEAGNALSEESARGYEKARPGIARGGPVVIAAAFRALPQAEELCAQARQGATLLLESGLPFASEEEVHAQRALLTRHFSIDIQPALWRTPKRAFRYIRLAWPVDVSVRDFSESAVITGGGRPIASADSRMLGVWRQFGEGRVIYLGFPLGPLVLGGDPQAEKWISALASIPR